MKNKIFFIVFIVIWCTLILFNFFKTNKTFSEQENRMLARMPKFSLEKLINGKYVNELDKYINDHFIFRDEWLKINSLMEKNLQKTEINGIYIGKNGFLFEKFKNNNENIDIATKEIEKFSYNVRLPVYFILVPNSIYINQKNLPNNVYVENQEEIIQNTYKQMEHTKTINVTDILKENSEQYLYFKTDHHITSERSVFNL